MELRVEKRRLERGDGGGIATIGVLGGGTGVLMVVRGVAGF